MRRLIVIAVLARTHAYKIGMEMVASPKAHHVAEEAAKKSVEPASPPRTRPTK